MEQKLPDIKFAIVKIIGVFNYTERDISAFKASGYKNIEVPDLPETISGLLSPDEKKKLRDDSERFFQDKYYTEFNELMLSGSSGKNRAFKKVLPKTIFNFYRSSDESISLIPIEFNAFEIHLAEDGVGLFSLCLQVSSRCIKQLSDQLFFLRNFDSKIHESNLTLHEWIELNVLNGIKIRGKDVEVDRFSGSKLKTYTILCLENSEDPKIKDHLIFELSTNSKIGSSLEHGNTAHSELFYNEMMSNKISAFNNYVGLATLDSFIMIGEKVFEIPNDNFTLNYLTQYHGFNTYNRVYYAIYIHNLYLKYGVFRFNAYFREDPLRYKDRFQQFINDHDIKHISFDFLPNLLNQKIRKALQIDEEILSFEKRLTNLANIISAEQNKRQSILLGFISVVTSLNVVPETYSILDEFRKTLALDFIVFHSIMVCLLILSAVILGRFLFPFYFKKLISRARKLLGR